MPDRIATQTSHLAQLRKSDFDRVHRHPKPDEDLAETTRAVRAALGKTEHFLFTAIPDHDDELEASIDAMQEAGVWRLPYPVCTFEYQAALNVLESPDLDSKVRQAFGGELMHCVSLCVEKEDGEPGIMATFIKANPHDKRSWVAIYHSPLLESGISAAHKMLSPNSDKIIDIPTEAEACQRGMQAGGMAIVNLGNGTAKSVGEITSACLVALHTRGIRRERWIGDKKVLVGRKEPADAYTRVMVAECMETGQGHSVPGERHRVRLHLRRGHTRQQPHGPGRRFVRTIYIAPMLIGYEEEGRITHDHYETYPQEHSHAD